MIAAGDETLSPKTRSGPPTADLVMRTAHAWLDGAFRSASILVTAGRISDVLGPDADVDAAETATMPANALLLPGLVDAHVHVNEPGRTEWEGFRSATRAAALGGVTTILDMPLNSSPVTTSRQALMIKREAAKEQVAVDVGFWGGAVPDNLPELRGLWDAGVFGFKCFLAPSGLEEFPPLDDAGLRRALEEVSACDGLLIVHAEDPAYLEPVTRLGTRYRDFLRTRPPSAETSAIGKIIDGVRATGARAHILHLSAAQALPMIRAAKADGLPITVETCPHYLTLVAERVPDGATEFKCCPPIRNADNQDALWEAILDGTIDLIASDHSPTTAELKRTDGDFGLAWGGISGLQVGFRAVWAEASRRGIPIDRILPAFTTGPSRVAGLKDRGAITIGAVAHLVAFDPEPTATVTVDELEHQNKISAYAGAMIKGSVIGTWLRGVRVAGNADGVKAVAGRLLDRATCQPMEGSRWHS